MAKRGGKKLPDKRGFVDGPGGYRGRDDRDKGFGDADSSGSGGTGSGGGGNVTSGTADNPIGTNVSFGQPDPRGNLPSYNPNLIGQYFGYYNPDYTPGGEQEIGGVSLNDMLAASEESTLDSFAGQNLSGAQQAAVNAASGNNFYSNSGAIPGLLNNLSNPGTLIGLGLSSAFGPLAGIIGGTIGRSFFDDEEGNFFTDMGKNIITDYNKTKNFFNPTVKEIDTSLDTSDIKAADLTGSEITNTVDSLTPVRRYDSIPDEETTTTSYNPFSPEFSYRDFFSRIFSPSGYQEGGRVGYNDGGIAALLNLSGNVGRSGGENYDFFEANPSISREDLELYANITGNKDKQMLNEIGGNYKLEDDLMLNVGMNPKMPQEFSEPEDIFFARLTKSFNQGGQVQESSYGIGNLFKMK
tara:strand:+ start:1029 stop:2261 length:1233 start_codon:yes stop_codon:yes gene_type:complete